jgi:hypothetical protein
MHPTIRRLESQTNAIGKRGAKRKFIAEAEA